MHPSVHQPLELVRETLIAQVPPPYDIHSLHLAFVDVRGFVKGGYDTLGNLEGDISHKVRWRVWW